MRPKVLLAVAAVAAFTLGTAAPEGWTLEDNGEDHFRTSEVDAAELDYLEPGRIATGPPAAHGDRLIYQPERFATDCPGPVNYSPGLGSNFS